MLDARVYRAAFLPALVALFVAAFALADRPPAASTRLGAQAFDSDRAFGGGAQGARPPRNSLRELAETFPSRRPGSAGDVGLADRVEQVLGQYGFQVSRKVVDGASTVDGRADLETVVGVRPGLSSRRVVVLAHRDALRAPGLAEVSGTAALLELARIFRSREAAGVVRGGERPRAVGRDLRKTLVLVSTSGATGGAAGARSWARAPGGPVDAVLVLGDLASEQVRKPWVVPWATAGQPAPLGLRRTVEAAVREEVGSDPGGVRAAGQWARRAVALTPSEQGPVTAAGLPAVLLSVSGERGPEPGAEVSAERLDEFGRAALRALSAVDARTAQPTTTEGVVTMDNVVPGWVARLLVAAALLPALLAAVDGFARARRRRQPVGSWALWLGLLTLPVLVAWGWARLLGIVGALPAPAAPVLPGALPLERGGLVALVSAGLAAVLAWLVVRPVRERLARAGTRARRGGTPGGLAAGGAGAALGLTLCGMAALVWVANPYAAALLAPAAHLSLFAAAPGGRARGWRVALALALGVLPFGLVALYYALALGIGPLGLAWTAFLAVVGGHAGLAPALVVAVLVAWGLALVAIVREGGSDEEPGPASERPIRTRGPLTYAGPGSLGGTESALHR